MRKQISMQFDTFKYTLIPMVFILLYNIYLIYTDMSLDGSLMLKVLFPLGGTLLIYLLYKVFAYYNRKALHVTFDSSLLYVKNAKNSFRIPLKNITEVKMMSFHSVGRHKIQLTYFTNQNTLKTIRFFPKFMYANLPELRELIISQNKDAKIQEVFKGCFLIEKYKN